MVPNLAKCALKSESLMCLGTFLIMRRVFMKSGRANIPSSIFAGWYELNGQAMRGSCGEAVKVVAMASRTKLCTRCVPEVLLQSQYCCIARASNRPQCQSKLVAGNVNTSHAHRTQERDERDDGLEKSNMRPGFLLFTLF